MGWIMILFIWLVAPFAELGIIIGLLVSNGQYKKRIHQLERKNLSCRASMASPENSLQQNLQEHPRETLAGASEILWETPPKSPEMLWKRDTRQTAAYPQGSSEEWYTVKEITGGKNQSQARETAWEEVQLVAETEAEEKMPCKTDEPLKEAASPQLQNQPRFGEAGTYEAPPKGLQASLGTLALVLGVILIVLAGLVFATTTWHILPDICKAVLVLAGAILFFAASFMAANVFHICRTGNAFYILGSIFLFLSVLAAAYFRLLGAEFILDEGNRWKVLWVGSALSMGAFWAGLKRFHDKIYTLTCLWGVSLNLFFMAKAFSVSWNGFVCMMTVYSVILLAARESLEKSAGQEGREELPGLLKDGFCRFAPIHFWTFGTIAMVRGLFAVWLMAVEGCMGCRDVFLDRFPLFSFTAFGMGAMGAVTAGMWILTRKENNKNCRYLYALAAGETILYAAGWMAADFIYRMAVINLGYLAVLIIRCRKREVYGDSHNLFLDICGCAGVLFTLISFYSDRSQKADGLVLCMTAFFGYYLWFYFGNRQWPHLLAAIGMIPLPFMAQIRLGLSFNRLAAWVAAALLISGIAARYFFPVMERDHRVQGQWRMDWYHMVSIWVVLLMAAQGNARWRFAYILLAAMYFLQYREVEKLRKPALFLSACCAAAAFWQQPFIPWPQVLELELKLLPAVWLMRTAGVLWDEIPWIAAAKNLGYVICLILLCGDAVFSGQVADALLLEGICLALFMWAQVKRRLWWVRISTAIILAVALFMTRSFWLSISWWVYLLASGIGLIVFAGIMEKKRR